MNKTYNPKDIESKWKTQWEADAHPANVSGAEAFCMMLPPPNVTGTLHMGHGFQQTIMDAITRYETMRGKQTFWQAGTDHAGIATQMVVERQLHQADSSRHDLGREKFIERVWEWKQESGDIITNQMRRLGVFIDWSKQRFSMDEQMTGATTEAFVRLYKEGLIYRGKKLVNWDPVLGTAISDLEVETETKKGHMWHLRYPLGDGSGYLIVATTRPETMLGDAAVAVHPEDERYQKLIGKTVLLPLTDREIPIIADDYVDPQFGTGCVKITPAHDFNDYDVGQRHDLPLINIMTLDVKLNDEVPLAYRGLDRFDAREKIVADLEKLNLIEKIEDHELSIPKGDRSGAVIEPLLTSQWFVKMKTLAEDAIAAVDRGDLHFIPKNWDKTYMQWLNNIQDWCISRQLWWGHQIPVWYDEAANIFVGESEEAVRAEYNVPKNVPLTRDNDVLDTWFTSSLWPFGTLGWPEQTKELKTFYPTQVLVTGFDIIFFWVARMVMMGLHFTGQVPFEKVYVTGLIRDRHGKKMSKTKGNVLDPIDLIDGIDLDSLIKKRTVGLMQPQMAEKIAKSTREEFPDGIDSYGTDALRFTFCSLASTGRDINFDMGRIEGYRNFCNKLWNATRFVLMHTEDKDLNGSQAFEYGVAELWIKSRLQLTIKKVNDYFEQYRFDLMSQALYEFIWNEYCDWYLELAKCSLQSEKNKAQHRATRFTLLDVLETALRLMHPVMPYITEEIWQRVSSLLDKSHESIVNADYPVFDKTEYHSKAEADVHWLKQVVTAIRTIRSEMGVPPGKKVNLLFSKGGELDKVRTDLLLTEIKSLARIDQLEWVSQVNEPSSTALVGELECHIPLAGVIDKDAEIIRLKKEMKRLQDDMVKSERKLSNENYLAKAPAEVVQKEKERFTQAEMSLEKLEIQLSVVSEL